MKKINNSSLKSLLTIAATSLIGNSAHADYRHHDDWDFSASILDYAEKDRVSTLEFIGNADKTIDQTGRLSIHTVLDSLSGASPNGAIVQPNIQTFTAPSGDSQYISTVTSASGNQQQQAISGESQYSARAGETPLDTTFKDTREELNVSWQDALSDEANYTIGSYLSVEHDYMSFGINGELARNFNQNNTTLSIASSFANNSIKPKSSIPIPLASMVIDYGQFRSVSDYRSAYDLTRVKNSESMQSAEMLFGLTQVISRKMLVQLNLGYSDSQGYLTDPYKIFSIVDSQGITQDYQYEKRPDKRVKESLFSMAKYHLDHSVLDVSYRMMKDDWGIKSNTFNVHWHLMGRRSSYWEPNIRYYKQSAANFYRAYVLGSESPPEFVSADYRLANITGWTLGLKYGFKLSHKHHAEIRAEIYQQQVDGNGEKVLSALNGLDLHPNMTSVMVQMNYYF